jgi:hypothetical protein
VTRRLLLELKLEQIDRLLVALLWHESREISVNLIVNLKDFLLLLVEEK